MKRIVITSLLVVMVLGIEVAFAPPEDKGHGGPSGQHFNLNLIGVKEGHEKNMENCDSGHRIFVKLGGSIKKDTKINLVSCEAITGDPDCMEFGVLDCDGTDGEASFMLPNPDPGTGENCTRYSVWVRSLGSPKGEPTAEMQTCATECLERDPVTGECTELGDLVCSTEYVELKRTKGKQRFVDVSRELLTICVWVCVDVDPTSGECLEWELQRRYLFDPMFENYYWKYTSGGIKLVQLRFYLEEQCYSDDDWKCKNITNTPHP